MYTNRDYAQQLCNAGDIIPYLTRMEVDHQLTWLEMTARSNAQHELFCLFYHELGAKYNDIIEDENCGL